MVHQQKGGDGPAFSVVCIERFGRVRCIQEVGTREKSVSVDQKAVVVILIQMAEGVVMRVIVAPASLVLVIFGYQFVILLRAVRWECMRKLIGNLIIGSQVGCVSFYISQQVDIDLLPVHTGVVGRFCSRYLRPQLIDIGVVDAVYMMIVDQPVGVLNHTPVVVCKALILPLAGHRFVSLLHGQIDPGRLHGVGESRTQPAPACKPPRSADDQTTEKSRSRGLTQPESFTAVLIVVDFTGKYWFYQMEAVSIRDVRRLDFCSFYHHR